VTPQLQPRLDFPDLVVRSVYAPFNGAGKQGHYDRRREWDRQLLEEMQDPGDWGKARILMGDLNVVNRDSDISGSPDFWKKQGATSRRSMRATGVSEEPPGTRGNGSNRL
jgi:exonuclease III